MKATVSRISAILYKHDPMKLAAIGAPSDEYQHEARVLAALYREIPTLMNAVEVRAVFWAFFGVPQSPSPETDKLFTLIADEIRELEEFIR